MFDYPTGPTDHVARFRLLIAVCTGDQGTKNGSESRGLQDVKLNIQA